MSTRKEKIKVYEMTCTSCEKQVKKAISKLEGIVHVKVSYSGEYAEVEYDEQICSLGPIKEAIRKAGYSTEGSKDYTFIGIITMVIAILLLGLNTSGFDMDEKLHSASYAVLFIVGVLTSIHCIGMCGGIMLSQSLSKKSKSKFDAIKPALLYNLGRVVSYTILGGLIGAFGSVFSLSYKGKAAIQIFAGAFMIIMGLNMSGFKAFKRLQIRLPYFACKVKNKSDSAFIVGLLNGLMPCGPLQTMQIFALGTGSALKGSLSMFMFSLGTVPLMLTFGALSGVLSKGHTKKILKLSGVLIIVLGLIMGNRGFTILGITLNPLKAIAGNLRSSLTDSSSSNTSKQNVAKAVIQDGVQLVTMSAGNNGYTPYVVYVQKGMPVKWIISGDKLNACNNAIIVPSLNLEMKLKKGENLVKEFTPQSNDDIDFSCWMGMISGVIKVVDSLDTVDTSEDQDSLPPPSSGSNCCTVSLDEDAEPTTPSESSIY